MLDVHHRRLSLSKQRMSPNPLMSSTRKRHLSTPLRPALGLRTPSSATTPAEIRWPLVSFLRRHRFDDESIKLAIQTAATAPVLHQLILHHLEQVNQRFQALELACEQVKSREDLEVATELRKQFLRAALKSVNWSMTGSLSNSAESLRVYLIEAIDTSYRSILATSTINQAPLTPLKLMKSITPIRSASSRKRSPQLALPSYEATPIRGTDLLATPLVQPSPSTGFMSSNLPAIGDTPLDQVKATQINLRRVKALKALSQKIATPIKLLAQARLHQDHHRLSVIQEESPASSISEGPPKRMRSVQDSPTLKKQRRKALPLSQTSTTVETDAPVTRKKPVKGASTLLGCKAGNQGGRYVSRVAVTAKAKRTRERKALRQALHDENGEFIERNKSKRSRKATKIAELQEANLFVTKENEDVLDTFHVDPISESLAYIDSPDAPQYDENLPSFEPRGECTHVCDAGDTHSGTTQSSLEVQLKEVFGLAEFRPGQREAIKAILRCSDNFNLLVSLPTGMGKSLIFQMASFNLGRCRGQLTIVVCPTVPLLDDQYCKIVDLLGRDRKLLSAGLLHSGVSLEESRRVLNGIKNGMVDILFTTPEQFVTLRFIRHAKDPKARAIGLLCIDEAHCLSEWGHSFRPAYQKVLMTAQTALRIPKLLLTTATASAATLSSIRDMSISIYPSAQFALINPLKASQRPDLKKTVSFVDEPLTSLATLLHQADWRQPGMTLIYTWMKWMAERVCRRLKEEFPDSICLYYHSDLDNTEKAKVTSSFLAGKCHFLVATQALGIGMDSPHVARVVHLNLPSGLEQYIQEIGRCNRSRAFTPGLCHCFVANSDYLLRYQQIAASVVDAACLQAALRLLFLSEMPVLIDKSLRSKTITPTDPSPFIDLAKQPSAMTLFKLFKKAANGPRSIIQNSKERVRGRPYGTRSHPFEVRLSVVTMKELSLMLNVRSLDELQVILTLMDVLATKSQQQFVSFPPQSFDDAVRDIHNAYAALDFPPDALPAAITLSPPELSSSPPELSSSPPGESSPSDLSSVAISLPSSAEPWEACINCPLLKIWTVQSDGLEIRCYDRPLEELVEENDLLKFLSAYWMKVGGSGFYKLHWLDLLSSDRSLNPALFVDLDFIEQGVRDLAGKYHLSVRPLGFERLVIFRTLNSICNQSLLPKHVKHMCDKVLAKLNRNHCVQLNRLDAGFVAMHVRAELAESKMDEFIEDYFNWPNDLELLDRKKLWALPRFDPYRSSDLTALLDQPFESTGTGKVDRSQLRYAVEQVQHYLQNQLGLSLVPTNAASSILTPMMISRILCGIPSMRFSYTNAQHLPGWGSYKKVKFDSVVQLCRKVLSKNGASSSPDTGD